MVRNVYEYISDFVVPDRNNNGQIVNALLTTLGQPPVGLPLMLGLLEELQSSLAKDAYLAVKSGSEIVPPHPSLVAFMELSMRRSIVSGWTLDRPLNVEEFERELRNLATQQAPDPARVYANLHGVLEIPQTLAVQLGPRSPVIDFDFHLAYAEEHTSWTLEQNNLFLRALQAFGP